MRARASSGDTRHLEHSTKSEAGDLERAMGANDSPTTNSLHKAAGRPVAHFHSPQPGRGKNVPVGFLLTKGIDAT
jgi:hypothetical protein